MTSRTTACGGPGQRPVGRRPGRQPHPRRRRHLRVRADADHHDQGPRPAPVLSAAETIREHLRRGPARHPPVDDVPGHDDRAVPRGPRAERASPPARTSTSPSRPSGSTRATRPAPARASRAWSVRPRRGRHGARRRPAAEHQRARRDDDLARRGRALEAARERLPQRQHRVRQQPRPALRADGPRRLGGHQRGGDEAVRVHEVHARARASVATASRWIRTTWPGGRASSTSSIASSSSPATSTSRCRGTSSTSSAEALNDRGKALKGAKVGVLGVAFKPNVRDARNSPAADVIAGIADRGADVRFHDPHVTAVQGRRRSVVRENTRPRGAARLGGRHRRRDGPRGHRLGAHVRARRPHRRHRRLVARHGRHALARSCAWVPGGRRGPDRGRRRAAGPHDRPQLLRRGPASPARGRGRGRLGPARSWSWACDGPARPPRAS